MTPPTPWNRRELEPEELGRRIRAARRSAGLTQAQLGGSQASVAYISRIESGQRRPSSRLLIVIAERLEIAITELTDPGGQDLHSGLRVALAQAELAVAQGLTDDALHQLSEIIASADADGLRALGDHATIVRAEAQLTDGRPSRAIATLTQRFGHDVEQSPSVRVCTLLSECYLATGQVSEAVRAAEHGARMIDEYDLQGLPEALAHAATHARALIDNNDPLRAAQVCRDALKASDKVNTFHELSDAYWHASIQEATAGAITQAAFHVTLAEAAREVELHDTHLRPVLEQLERAVTTAEAQAF